MSRPLKGNSVRITVTGVVQGVGFRPFVARLARHHHISGTVANTSSGVIIHAQGPAHRIAAFVTGLRKTPPRARVTGISSVPVSSSPRIRGFSIVASTRRTVTAVDLPADSALCPACRRELNDPSDRRYRYPFINCTDCGPRYTITRTLPYDRPQTTMRSFHMCSVCQAEYDDPSNRRFHAQPNACPACGPTVFFERLAPKAAAPLSGDSAMRAAAGRIARGSLVAIKSIGGYHLSCDAENRSAIATLRRRKSRPRKPFAVMMADLRQIGRICHVSPLEHRLLTSPQAPIVLLRKRLDAGRILPTIEQLAPGNAYLGVMLPYTPLHEVLFRTGPFNCLVMTSGNRQDEPICHDEVSARERLTGIADCLLWHDRPIHNRCDDSIVQVVEGVGAQFIRRSRGSVPEPVVLPSQSRAGPALGVGAELKNTFCLTRGAHSYPSAYIGDLDNDESLRFFRESHGRFTRFLQVKPRVVAHDLHPDYLSTAFARRYRASGARTIAVQHHHAHIASVCAEHGLTRPVIGFAFDGTGFGIDGAVWGGECFTGVPGRFERRAHLEYFALPGGDQATREIWRIGISLLRHANQELRVLRLPRAYAVNAVSAMIDQRINSPLCSSAGRLFDGVAALLGLMRETTFEAEAAMALERLALMLPIDSRPKIGYNFPCTPDERGGPSVMRLAPLIRDIVADIRGNVPHAVIAWRFHRTLAEMIVRVASDMRKTRGLKTVALSGGVFQNRLLLSLAVRLLKARGFTVAVNTQVPPNDGCISLGQAWTALQR